MMKRIIIILIVLFTYFTGYNQSESNLIGRDLVKASDLGAAVESGIGLLFGASEIKGKIEKVTVTDATYKEIQVKITYSGFAGNWLKGSFLAADKSVLRAVSTDKASLTAGTTEVEMIFTKDLNVDTAVVSAYLKLLVCKQEKDVTGLAFYYILQKKWESSGISDEEPVYSFINESLIVRVDPVPIGVASQLRDVSPEEPLPEPAKVHTVIYNNQIYENKTVNRTKMLAMQSPAAATHSDQQMKSTDKSKDFKQPQAQITADKRAALERSQNISRANPATATENFNLDQEQLSKGAKGPGYMAITLWDEISSDPGVNFDFSEEYKITNINFDIFPDSNENSGYYYYFPASYALQWDRENSYQLNILYGTASEEGESMIKMFMTITPAVSSKDKAMVEKIVRDYTQRKGKPFEKLTPLPLKESPKADLTGILGLWDVPPDRIATITTNIFESIQVSWPISSTQANELLVYLKENNLSGTLTLKPEGTLSNINIPIKVSLGDDQTFGKIILQGANWRIQTMKNEMPFPIRLKYIHALFLNKEQSGSTTPYIYSWDLQNKDVPVLSTIQFNAVNIPNMVDTRAERIWVEYSVPDCLECMDKVINDMTTGTVSARQQRIEMISYGIIENTGAHVMAITIRSKFADPKGKSIEEITPVRIVNDEESYFTRPLIVPEEQTLEYEYKIKLVTDDEVMESDWIYSSSINLDFTKSLVERALGKTLWGNDE